MERPAAHAEGRRMSIFTEVGLVDENRIQEERSPVRAHGESLARLRPVKMLRFKSRNDIFNENGERQPDDEDDWESVCDDDEANESSLPTTATVAAPYFAHTKLYRLGLLSLLLALMLPIVQLNPLKHVGVRGGMIPTNSIQANTERSILVKRDDSPTDACRRWSGQSAIVNGTLYMYGFRRTTEAQQTQNTWNNDFLTLDLTQSWQVSSPALTGLPKPAGPPAVSLGQLWASHESLWLYGGQFSDSPIVQPANNSIWEYKIASKQWAEHADPKTSAGQKAENDGQSVQRVAEGAGLTVSTLGRGFYFAGHLDFLTTQGWSNQIARVYLKSLLEFTFPGQSNNAVNSLQNGKTAGSDGAFRNITYGGLQNTASFPERADSALVYVPGFGDEGLLIGVTGGDNATFTQMNTVDVYDIAASTWYKQTTSGKTPSYRVNPCTVVAAATDGSSYNIYMYAGQDLEPAGKQTQRDDMWILSIPSFTWIEVNQGTDKASMPPPRAGHLCQAWDAQMIVMGGYNTNLGCDAPGIYVFNMSSLSWSNQFTSVTGKNALQQYNSQDKGSTGNPLSQQINQRGFGVKAGIEGSYGYAVPEAVQSVIGGKATGGATLTAPVQTPTSGPLATGKPQTYTMTGPDGAKITHVINGNPQAINTGDSGPNIAAIVAGVIAGVFFVVAAYFAFCAWIYRRQVQIWKQHAATVQSRANAEKQGTFTSSSGLGTVGGGSSHGAAAGSFDIGRGNTSGEAATAYGGPGAEWGRRNSEGSVVDGLLDGQEPSFWGARGVLLNPRRSLRVINRD
ncbi:kelch repeat [Pyrenophora seminiperda CCB06]|uniref:Kelch repeat n=1 Tax=Pyrenophora seminiperda CCB06 TaxID=1302712 RepID=A0A3M7MBW6_9PLEO|nr:kelch repeat [Pyrenophora seminiperda CCB06]